MATICWYHRVSTEFFGPAGETAAGPSDSWKLREAYVLYSKFDDFHGMRNHTQYREGAFSSKIGSGDDNTRGCFTSWVVRIFRALH